MASVTDDTTTIKLTENYQNDRTTYKLNSGLFTDTTAQRIVFYFFFHRTKYFQIQPPHKWHIWFCPKHKADPSQNQKSFFLPTHRLKNVT